MPTHIIAVSRPVGSPRIHPRIVWRVSTLIALVVFTAFLVVLDTRYPGALASISEIAGP